MTQKVSVRRRFEPGIASNYIEICKLKPGDKFVICPRVSKREQERQLNLQLQDANLRAVVAAAGAVVVAAVPHVGPGWDPSWLRAAAAIARRHGAALVAETTDRFIRSHAYHSQSNPEAQPHEVELEYLAACTAGVKLMTLTDPDATNAEMRSYQTKRGQRMRGRRGGRPKNFTKEQLAQMNQSKMAWGHAIGLSYRRLEKFTGIPATTVRRWVRHFLGGEES